MREVRGTGDSKESLCRKRPTAVQLDGGERAVYYLILFNFWLPRQAMVVDEIDLDA
jgi:hypothetical protein